MTTGFFRDVTEIRFEGPGGTNALDFQHYYPNEVVMGKRMEDHVRFAVSYWHNFDRAGNQTFGRPFS